MLRPNGQAVLIDFGIACELVPMVPTSKHFAQRDFAPWEQRKGSGKPTVDIYALAASLYYAVTGETPTPSFEGLQNVAWPPAKDFGVKDWVSQAIEKGMESDPQKRPQSMQEWLTYLREPTISSVSVQLKSAQGVDYTRLRDLLAAGMWKEADLETRNVMLKATKGEKEGYFNKPIDNFPCDDLRTIDYLWVTYSEGRFGFSVQKKIWLEVGGKDDDKAIGKLGDYVGWRNEYYKIWLKYEDLTFNMQARSGHLPGFLGVNVFAFMEDRRNLLMGIFSSIENCNL